MGSRNSESPVRRETAMTKLHLLSLAERKPFFEVVAANRNLPLDIVEKDFWVVWMLGHLFSL